MDNETIDIRPAVSEADGEIVLALIEQLAQFEHLTPPDEEGRQRFLHDGFVRQPPRFEAWIAYSSGGAPAGYALVFETYSTFLCKPSLYLEDLFVLPEYRGQGYGK